MSYNSIQAISLASKNTGVQNAYYDGVILSGEEIRALPSSVRLTNKIKRRLPAISLALGGFNNLTGASKC
jgi:hypothetical protein